MHVCEFNPAALCVCFVILCTCVWFRKMSAFTFYSRKPRIISNFMMLQSNNPIFNTYLQSFELFWNGNYFPRTTSLALPFMLVRFFFYLVRSLLGLFWRFVRSGCGFGSSFRSLLTYIVRTLLWNGNYFQGLGLFWHC
jgi:hypothetical protein